MKKLMLLSVVSFAFILVGSTTSNAQAPRIIFEVFRRVFEPTPLNKGEDEIVRERNREWERTQREEREKKQPKQPTEPKQPKQPSEPKQPKQPKERKDPPQPKERKDPPQPKERKDPPQPRGGRRDN